MVRHQFSIIKNNENKSSSIEKELREKLLALNIKENQLTPDIVFVIGGDGTFLRAVNAYSQQLDRVKFVGFKLGNVSFYHSFDTKNLDLIVNSVFFEQEKMFVNNYELLEISSKDQTWYAVNELRLLNVTQTITFEIFINNKLLEVFRGSGIIVSTKSGSSGLMRSAGGAVILAKNKLMQLQEIFPVANNFYKTIRSPLIFDDKQIIKLKFSDHFNSFSQHLQFVIDTFNICDKLSKEMEIKISNLTLKTLSFKKEDEFLINKINKSFV